jgi:hypothetical protein
MENKYTEKINKSNDTIKGIVKIINNIVDINNNIIINIDI